MRNPIAAGIALLLILSLAGQSCGGAAIRLSNHVSLIPGPVNGVSIERDDARLVIYGNGNLFDLYSLQDAVSEAKISGYHGWAGRMGDLINSLQKVAANKSDILVPARGPVIRNPGEAINLLIERLQAIYENYLSISAGRWYFKNNYDVLAQRVLGPDPKVKWMPWAEVIKDKPPEWIVPIGNSRLIVSEDRSGFLIDCGSRRILGEVIKLRESGKITGIDEQWIRFYPYGQKARPGQTVQISLKAFNHSNVPRVFKVALNLPAGFGAARTTASVTIPPRTEQQVDFDLLVGTSIEPGTYVLTADVAWARWNLSHWTEAIIEIE